MKLINKIALISASAFVLTACQPDLLDTNPYDKVATESMWKNESLADMGVNGVYSALRQARVAHELFVHDAFGFTGQARDAQPLLNGTATAGYDLFSNSWKELYEGISRANDALANLPNVPMEAAKIDRLTAECKFLRAYYYFRLNRVFQGVPVYLEPIDDADCTKGRETADAVWTVIINDLTDCINSANLPGKYAAKDAGYGRATKGAAYALRGQVYMWKKDYKNAEADFRAVGTLGFSLYQGTYKSLFKEANEQCDEMIFSEQNMGEKDYGSKTQFWLGSRVSFGSCWNSYLPHPNFVESYECQDGTPFNWNNFLPGYNAMTPKERIVFFLRDTIGNGYENYPEGFKEKLRIGFKNAEKAGADMSKYLPQGNEARLRAAYDNRDPRLEQTIITPYAEYKGAIGSNEHTYTLRWPCSPSDEVEPYDLKTDTQTFFYYLYRKFVAEGASEFPNREYGPIDYPLIRYADVVLMLAEAINEQRFDAEAVDLVNSVRNRAGVAPLQTTDATKPTYVSGQDNLRERIRNERRWEFPIEGINPYDEIRWRTLKDKVCFTGNGSKQIWGEVVNPYSWKGDYVYTWAIPSTERERNPNIQQNDGWID